MKGKRYDRLDYAEAQSIAMNYVCAQCWGTVQIDFDKALPKDKRYKVVCPICGEDRGFVTKEYANQRRAESHAEAVEVERNLGDLLGIEKKPFDQEKAINLLWPE